jgi:predicted small lipoprotein YifL
MSIKLRHYICATVALVLISACGQKGPLYLPDKNGKKPVTAVPDVSGPGQKLDPEKKDDSQKPASP